MFENTATNSISLIRLLLAENSKFKFMSRNRFPSKFLVNIKWLNTIPFRFLTWLNPFALRSTSALSAVEDISFLLNPLYAKAFLRRSLGETSMSRQ